MSCAGWDCDKKARSFLVALNRNDYLLEAKKNYVRLKFTEMLVTLKILSVSYRKQKIKSLVVLKERVFKRKANEIFYKFKKATNFGKLFFLP